MFDEQKYLQSTFSLFFPPQRSIVEVEKQIIQKLRQHYYLIPRGQHQGDVSSDVPQLIFASHHGHSQIVVADSSVTLNVNYSPDWQTKVTEARGYVLERADLAFDIMETLKDVQLLFCGSLTRVHLPSKQSDEAITQRVAETFLKKQERDPYHDIILRLTTVVDDLYFSNMLIQNYRVWNTGPLPLGGVLRLSRRQAVERGVEIISDYNSRYAFNEDRDFDVTRESARDIIDRNAAAIAKACAVVGEAMS